MSAATTPRTNAYESRRGAYWITTDAARFDVDVIHGYLARSYWAEGVPREIVERSIRHSLGFALFEWERQIGFARVITDRATVAYLADVFILESHRGRGLATWLMEMVLKHPDLQGLRRFGLVTRDAHGLYARSGFMPLAAPERHMEIVRTDLYANGRWRSPSPYVGRGGGSMNESGLTERKATETQRHRETRA